jgi:uncharacterized protein
MWLWQRKIVLRGLVATLCVAAAGWLALWYFIPRPPSAITMAVGIRGSAFEHFANRYRDSLAHQRVKLNFLFSKDASEYLRLLKDSKSRIDAAFVFGGQAANTVSPEFVSLGRINLAPLWIFYRGKESLDRLTQLKGKRVTVIGASWVHQILAANGVNRDNTMMSQYLGVSAAAKALRNNDVDAAILPPIDLSSPSVQSLLRDPAIRLMNLAQAEALTRLFPSLKRVILPQGVIDLETNIPASDVNLIASTNAVVVRKELHPELIYLLARTLQEVHGGPGIFQRAGEFPTQTDPEFPMAEEAIDFYKDGPSLLQRYLPFWTINYVKRVVAILVTVIAIVIPVFTFAPKLYNWILQFHLKKLYGRLRTVEMKLEATLTASQIAALQDDVENIDRASRIVPLRHSDLFFTLRHHIKLTRDDLNRRLVEIGGLPKIEQTEGHGDLDARIRQGKG